MIKIAVLGYGVVGSGVVEVIERNNAEISRKAGDEVAVKYILDLRDFPGDPHEDKIVHDFDMILKDPEVSVLCENGVHMHMPLEKGIQCRTILALGFEKTGGVWEMISSGKGVSMALADICRSYGVTVLS